MESLKGFVRRHGDLTHEKFVDQFPHPFLVSRQKSVSSERLFPGSWVITIKKTKKDGLAETISLGRSGTQDILIDDQAVSKAHCTFTASRGNYQIADANSTNGTTLNGHRLPAHVPFDLSTGDKIVFGDALVFYFFTASDLYNRLLRKARRNR